MFYGRWDDGTMGRWDDGTMGREGALIFFPVNNILKPMKRTALCTIDYRLIKPPLVPKPRNVPQTPPRSKNQNHIHHL